MSRLLGVDLGERRIGLALADGDGSPARPHSTLRRGRDIATDAAALGALIEQLSIGELIVGLPLEASGADGPQAGKTRAWATAVGERLGIPVLLRDERLTSHLAEERLGPMKRGRSGGPPSKTQRDAYRARVDRAAAAIILQDELDTRAGRRSSSPRTPDPPGDRPMTIRTGGRPRDGRATPVRPYDPEAYATESVPEFLEPPPHGRGGGGGGGGGGAASGLIGLLKFLVFAAVLAGVVLAVGLTVLRPVVNSAVMSVAEDNPAALQLPFVRDIVEEHLGTALTTPASTDAAQVEFLVEHGDTARTIALELQKDGLLTDRRAFVFIAIDRDLTGSLQQGTFVLRKNMTPDQLVSALLAPPEVKYVDIALRTGLRLEQITAKLQTVASLDMDAQDFYDLAKTPPAALVADYPWLKAILATAPEGASLEGFLWPATYRVLPDTTAEELVRLMLDKFIADVGQERVAVSTARGLSFYQVLTLASIVEREAVLDEERPLIAGVYQNRIDGIPGIKTKLLNADPTVFYAIDTIELDKLEFNAWQRYAFWTPPGVPLAEVTVPEDLQGYQTYQTPGLITGPICTPSLPSIDAALEPDTGDKFIYFLAIPDSSGAHAFAKTKDEHDANRQRYGYIP